MITRPTRLKELIERFNTRGQAKFYIEHAGGDFSEYEREDAAYRRALEHLDRSLDIGLKVQHIDRMYLPTFMFSTTDLIVALGQDGLVANTAKYAGSQPIIGVNPDPSSYDGVLVALSVSECRRHVELALQGRAALAPVTLAQAQLADGQKLLAFNDLFIGIANHTSARYKLTYNDKSEQQSSSGLIVATGAGSTGWLSSIFNMVASINRYFGSQEAPRLKLEWNSDALAFVVREPFISRHSSAGIVAGMIGAHDNFVIQSEIPLGGTIFSDGVERDFLTFNSGAIATVGLAQQKARLVRCTP